MIETTYSEKLKDPRWQRKRLEVFQRDGFTCQCCNDDKKTLHVHHKKYSGEPWEANLGDLTTLCEDCHQDFEDWIYYKKDRNFLAKKIKFSSKDYKHSLAVIKYSNTENYAFLSYLNNEFKGGYFMTKGEVNDLIAFLSDIK